MARAKVFADGFLTLAAIIGFFTAASMLAYSAAGAATYAFGG